MYAGRNTAKWHIEEQTIMNQMAGYEFHFGSKQNNKNENMYVYIRTQNKNGFNQIIHNLEWFWEL